MRVDKWCRDHLRHQCMLCFRMRATRTSTMRPSIYVRGWFISFIEMHPPHPYKDGSGSTEVSGPSSPESSNTPPSSAGSSSSSSGAPNPPVTPIIDIDGPSGVNEPFPVPQTGPERYVHSLMRQNRGYPLWIPSPSMSLPALYRASGVRLGDVGIITPEGGFSFFFNVLHGATHPINTGMLLPEHFTPYVSRGRTGSLVHIESSVMTCLASDTLMTKNCYDG